MSTVLVAALALLGATSAVRAGEPADPGKLPVKALVEQLPACEELQTCPAASELIRRGKAIWPEAEVGLKHAEELVRFWTLGVLSEVVVPESRDAIAALIGDKEIRVRAAAAFALGNFRDKAVTPHLLEALADKDLNVRFAAAVALGKVADPAAVPALMKACRDRDEDVRSYAALALGDIGDRRATPRLLERLEEDADAKVRGFAAIALGNLRDPASLRPLLARLGAEKDDKALASAVFALGELGDPAAVAPLEALQKHESPEVREYAADALAKLRKPREPARKSKD